MSDDIKKKELPPVDGAATAIKYSKLDINIPADNELRDYLANKAETGTVVHPVTSCKIKVREPMDRWPRTLLLMPPITLSEGTVKRVVPPLGLAYIGGYLESKGIPFKILDSVVEGLDNEVMIGPKTWMHGMSDADIEKYIRDFQPEIVGLSILYSTDLHSIFRIAGIIKKVNPATTIISGGIHPSIYPREVLKEAFDENGNPTIDYVIRGEGEHRLAEFITNYKEGMLDLKSDGLCGWHKGTMFINHQIHTIANLDALPLPAYHHLPLEKYFDYGVPFSPFPLGKRVMQIYTSRGCPVGCTFCSSTNFNKGYRFRSPEAVYQEVKYYKEKYQIDEIQFADDNLTFNRPRSFEMFEKLKACGLPWCTPNGTMVNTLSEPLLAKMIESGLYQVTLSLDSGSAKTLREHHRKPVDLTRVPDLAKYLKSKGILIHATFVVGMPGETMEDIEEGFRYAETLPLDSIGVFIAQALPGSELYEKAVAEGTMDRQRARVIDTAQSRMTLTSVDGQALEKRVNDFLEEYNMKIKTKNSEMFEKKYKRVKEKMSKMCIGLPLHPNLGTLINTMNAFTPDLKPKKA